MASENKPRVIVIGLDGATFKNLRPWMGEGLLPNLKYLADNGVSGELESTIPAYSAPAWTSFMTGVNPGKHGIFGFVKPISGNNGYKKEIVSSRDIGVETILGILSKKDKKIISINLPMTYPAFEINGLMIGCGLLAPGMDSNLTYPKDLFQRFGIRKSEYILDVEMAAYGENEKKKLILDLIDCAKKKKKVALKLINSCDWDLFITVFGETDRLQHRLWHLIDPAHLKYNQKEAKKIAPLIIEFYQNIDAIIGEFIQYIDDNTSLLIVSDHGFGCLEKQIALHPLLEQNGLLSHKNTGKNPLPPHRPIISRLIKKIIGFTFRMILSRYYSFMRKKYRKKIIMAKPRGDAEDGYLRTLDWEKTLAYMGSDGNINAVFLNMKGMGPEGVIDSKERYEEVITKVMNLMSNLYDPKSKKQLQCKFYKKEDIYKGQYLSNAPDLYFQIEDGSYQIQRYAGAREIVSENNWMTGWHRNKGILICFGKNFKKSFNIREARLMDIAPTILHLLHCQVPEYMDGKVLEAAITQEFMGKNPVSFERYSQEVCEEKRKEEVYSKEDEENVKRHLSALGYMD